MKKIIFGTAEEVGRKSADLAEAELKQAIAERGTARLLVATGESQLLLLSSLRERDIDWTKVELFHLDEYIGIDESHKASFVKYLKERFVKELPLKVAYYIDGTSDMERTIEFLTKKLAEAPITVGLVGIGENSHIAFNDPPANFDTKESYIVVRLDSACKAQQVREGWFDSLEQVPETALTMSVHEIMKCETIVSCVPYQAKAVAVAKTLQSSVTNQIPATILHEHKNWTLILDQESASLL